MSATWCHLSIQKCFKYIQAAGCFNMRVIQRFCWIMIISCSYTSVQASPISELCMSPNVLFFLIETAQRHHSTGKMAVLGRPGQSALMPLHQWLRNRLARKRKLCDGQQHLMVARIVVLFIRRLLSVDEAQSVYHVAQTQAVLQCRIWSK